MKHSQAYRAAIHEAAHAVIRLQYRIPFVGIEVYDRTEARRRGASGYLSTTCETLTAWSEVHGMVVSTLASFFAEVRLLPDDQPRAERMAEVYCADDIQEAFEIISRLGLPYADVARTAKFNVERWWEQIERVAAELVKRRKL